MTVHYLTADEMVAFKTLSDPVYEIYAQMLLDDGLRSRFRHNLSCVLRRYGRPWLNENPFSERISDDEHAGNGKTPGTACSEQRQNIIISLPKEGRF
jgi:hypothetical protein